MKKALSILLILIATLALGVTINSASADNMHGISLLATVDPEAELAEGGDLSYIRFDVSNHSNVNYTLNNVSIACDSINFVTDVSELITITAQTTREFYIEHINIPDSALDKSLLFELRWDDITYSAEDPLHQYPIKTPQSAEAKVTVERFLEPIITLNCTTAVEMARPNDSITFEYKLENTTKFDMYNLVLYDPGVADAPIELPDTTLMSGASLTATYQAQMDRQDLKSNSSVTYTVRNKPVQTISQSNPTVTCAIVELAMSIQSLPTTSEGNEFSITVTNMGTQPITNIQVYDEINSKIGDSFDLDVLQSKTISYVAKAALSSNTIRYISFKAVGTDCFLEPYLYEDKTSYPIIPYVDPSLINITLSAVLEFAGGDYSTATVRFEIDNASQIPISDARLVETSNPTVPIASFVQLSSGITAFSYDYKLNTGVAGLSFVLTATDPSGAPCSTNTIYLDLSPLFEQQPNVDIPVTDSVTIGGQYDMSHIADIVKTILITVCIVAFLGLVTVGVLYAIEAKQKPILGRGTYGNTSHTSVTSHTPHTAYLYNTDGNSISGDIRLNETGASTAANDDIKSIEEELLPFNNMGYVVPAKLRYYAASSEEDQNQPNAQQYGSQVAPQKMHPAFNTRALKSQYERPQSNINEKVVSEPVDDMPTVVIATVAQAQIAAGIEDPNINASIEPAPTYKPIDSAIQSEQIYAEDDNDPLQKVVTAPNISNEASARPRAIQTFNRPKPQPIVKEAPLRVKADQSNL